MRTEQFTLTSINEEIKTLSIKPQLILVFGERVFMENCNCVKNLASIYPEAILAGCSTSGEIVGEKVYDNTLVVTAIEFEKTTISFAQEKLGTEPNASVLAGEKLAKGLNNKQLRHVMVFSDGLHVNGTELVKGLSTALPAGVTVTGGLAGDGPNFEKTYIIDRNGELKTKEIIAIGLSGDHIKVGFGSRGGWDSFGLDRLVTKATGNVLFEIDEQPALDLYKSFLGSQAEDLPASGLLFPLSMRTKEHGEPVVRTILGINETEKSLTFAGDIPEGSFVRLMKANSDRLISGAEQAAQISIGSPTSNAELAILVSCVGRKLVLKQLVEEEVEAVSEVLGKPAMTGFYSYGELAPFGFLNNQCELHNQTMTITTLTEI